MRVKKDPIQIALEWEKKKKVAIATVIQTWGSAPCPVGSQLVVNENGNFEGSVSGGCIESAVISEASFTLKNNQPQLLSFGISSEQAWETGLACGGTIEIWIEAVAPHHWLWEEAYKLKKRGEKTYFLTNLKNGKKIFPGSKSEEYQGFISSSGFREIEKAFQSGCSKTVFDGQTRYFLHCIGPAAQLFVVGAVHIAQALSALAAVTGYDVILIDPRTAFATHDRFPDADIRLAWPEQAFKSISLHSNSALVALSHTPIIDDPALIQALQSDAFYIGALGSQKTHANRKKRLLQAGFSLQQLERIHGPVGLSIGSTTPAEIALSIMAEITKEKNRHRYHPQDEVSDSKVSVC